jgi:hypothetical protein
MNKYFEKMSSECFFARESRSQDELGLGWIDVETCMSKWRHYSNVDHLHFHLLLNIDTTSQMKQGNEMDFQTLKRRRFVDVEATSVHRRWNDVGFSTLKRRRFPFAFSTLFRRRFDDILWRRFDVALPAGSMDLLLSVWLSFQGFAVISG